MPLPLPLPLPSFLAATVLLSLSLTPLAAELPARIARVTIYPGTAVVERTARVPAGAREVVLNCLSPQFDMASLQIEADAPIRLGPVTATTRPRSELPACSTSPLDGRITALEDRIAALTAEHASHALVLGLLKGTTATVAANTPLASTLPLVQRAGLEALQQQHRLQREREKLERELAPLKAERERQQPVDGEVRQLRVQLQAGAEGELRLQYQTPGPTWAPAYRATLDPAAAVVEMERQAQVSQNTGEDWSGVALRLSTGSPQSATSGPAPRRWEISPRPPVSATPLAMAMAAAPAPMASMLARKGGAAAESAESMDFAVQVVQGEFATEFEVPGKVDVASGGQRVAFALGSQRWPARVKVQTVPQSDPSAWLVAEVARPEGVWPDGSLQLLRGTQVVGRSVWRTGERAQIALSFGRDEQVRVQNLPVTPQTASAGFIGTRTERRVGRLYEVENRRRTPVTLEVLESTPVSTDEKITVTRQFTPAPQPGDWQDQPGIVAWTQTLAPGQKARFGAEYVIGQPKELQVIERR
ncbi:DUF4139 domain-containing protein [Sphaerotilus sp.]|uniref:DUF4139 domain-containing protein n=1 Tax=Sphaerotilus sp. TaxID=2093942 RepID=UPI002ACD6AC9|nr:DUF4139 domain-containing protein [Sphaerotilus sp.]MDZ7856929.1 DUF4139 domain-containing protein [Sphaerotilus sp.]